MVTYIHINDQGSNVGLYLAAIPASESHSCPSHLMLTADSSAFIDNGDNQVLADWPMKDQLLGQFTESGTVTFTMNGNQNTLPRYEKTTDSTVILQPITIDGTLVWEIKQGDLQQVTFITGDVEFVCPQSFTVVDGAQILNYEIGGNSPKWFCGVAFPESL